MNIIKGSTFAFRKSAATFTASCETDCYLYWILVLRVHITRKSKCIPFPPPNDSLCRFGVIICLLAQGNGICQTNKTDRQTDTTKQNTAQPLFCQ